MDLLTRQLMFLGSYFSIHQLAKQRIREPKSQLDRCSTEGDFYAFWCLKRYLAEEPSDVPIAVPDHTQHQGMQRRQGYAGRRLPA